MCSFEQLPDRLPPLVAVVERQVVHVHLDEAVATRAVEPASESERVLQRLVAMREGRVIPITTDDLLQTAKTIKPSTRAWFESAKNYAIYSNQSGFYDDVLTFLGIKK